MKTLKEIQEGMQAYVLEKDVAIAAEIIKPKNIDATARLHVYRNGYYLRLVEILQRDYAVLYEIMGADAFDAMARDYLDAFPPHHFSVRHVGKYLPKFLKNTKHCDANYCELAEFAWAVHVALYAADAEILALDDLAQLSPEKWTAMKLSLHPSVQLLRCRFNTMERWQSNNHGQGDIPSEPLLEARYHLIWRYEREAYFCALTPEQSYLIHAIATGASFGDLCEAMLQHFSEEEAVQWVANTLQTWLAEGIFSKIFD